MYEPAQKEREREKTLTCIFIISFESHNSGWMSKPSLRFISTKSLTFLQVTQHLIPRTGVSMQCKLNHDTIYMF